MSSIYDVDTGLRHARDAASAAQSQAFGTERLDRVCKLIEHYGEHDEERP